MEPAIDEQESLANAKASARKQHLIIPGSRRLPNYLHPLQLVLNAAARLLVKKRK